MNYVFFFFNDTATTEIYTLSLHDALPISFSASPHNNRRRRRRAAGCCALPAREDRKSTRLNSSHLVISYAVFCLKKKKILATIRPLPPYFRQTTPKLKLCLITTSRQVYNT